MIKEAKWSKVPGLCCGNRVRIHRCTRLRTAELATGTPLLWEGLGDRATMQPAQGQQERRAQGWASLAQGRFSHWEFSLWNKEASLPWMEQRCQKNRAGRWKLHRNQGLFLLSTGQLGRGRLGSELTGLARDWELLKLAELGPPQSQHNTNHSSTEQLRAQKSSSQLTLHSAPLIEKLYMLS